MLEELEILDESGGKEEEEEEEEEISSEEEEEEASMIEVEEMHKNGVRRLVDSNGFQYLILGLILFNSILLYVTALFDFTNLNSRAAFDPLVEQIPNWGTSKLNDFIDRSEWVFQVNEELALD